MLAALAGGARRYDDALRFALARLFACVDAAADVADARARRRPHWSRLLALALRSLTHDITPAAPTPPSTSTMAAAPPPPALRRQSAMRSLELLSLALRDVDAADDNHVARAHWEQLLQVACGRVPIARALRRARVAPQSDAALAAFRDEAPPGAARRPLRARLSTQTTTADQCARAPARCWPASARAALRCWRASTKCVARCAAVRAACPTTEARAR